MTIDLNDVAARVTGEQGDAAKQEICRKLKEAGMPYEEAIALCSAIYWQGWDRGWEYGRYGGRRDRGRA